MFFTGPSTDDPTLIPVPLWPPVPGLLDSITLKLDFSRKNEWGADEWRTYAMFLEMKGAGLVVDLCRTKIALIEQKKKASRRKIQTKQPIKPIKGLLSILTEPGTKRGRKKSDNLESLEYARMALLKRAELEADGQKVTNSQALEAVCNDLKLTRLQRQRIINNRNILNRISHIRKS
jgi:hypothetical protein